jgi:hypothetical protein
MFTEFNSPVTLWAFFYSALISIWISVFIERWRRKSNELRLHFGTLHMENSFDTHVRPEFIGNEEFSHENFKVNTKDVSRTGRKVLALNLVIQIFFIWISYFIFHKTY